VIAISLTVLFEDPFWIGLFERQDDNGYQAARVVFGAEPSDAEVFDFIITRYRKVRFSPLLPGQKGPAKRINPKRRQRLARTAVVSAGISTKSQEALKLQMEDQKKERRVLSRAEKDEQARLKYELKQQQRKEKHRGH
jgi:hypothetical protein